MWRNRLGLLVTLTIAVTLLLPLTNSTHTAAQAPSSKVNHFSLAPMNYDYGSTKLSTLVRIDNQTGKAWFVRVRLNPGNPPVPVWEWIDLPEAGSQPTP